MQTYEHALTAYREDSGSFNANLNQTALEIGAERHGGNISEAYRAAKADPRLAQEWGNEAIDRYLDHLPVSDATPETSATRPLRNRTDGGARPLR